MDVCAVDLPLKRGGVTLNTPSAVLKPLSSIRHAFPQHLLGAAGLQQAFAPGQLPASQGPYVLCEFTLVTEPVFSGSRPTPNPL